MEPELLLPSILAGLAVRALLVTGQSAWLLAKRLLPSERSRIRNPGMLVQEDVLVGEVSRVLARMLENESADTTTAIVALADNHAFHFIRRLVEWKLAKVDDTAVAVLEQEFVALASLYLPGANPEAVLRVFGVLEGAAEAAVGGATRNHRFSIPHEVEVQILRQVLLRA